MERLGSLEKKYKNKNSSVASPKNVPIHLTQIVPDGTYVVTFFTSDCKDIQSNFNGSNTLGTMKISSRQG